MINATNNAVSKVMLFAFALILSFGAANAQEKTLFFSQYIEGSSNNKAMEIYNPTADTVWLNEYAFPNVSNAPSTPGEYEFWNDFPDTAYVLAGDVYVIAHPSADPAILAEADYQFTFLSNGDDGFALVKGDSAAGSSFEFVDWIGSWDGDPGSGWDVAGVTNGTQNHTLVRKSRYMSGNPVPLASFGTDEFTSEWIVLDVDDFTGIGSHTVTDPEFTLRDFNYYRDPITIDNIDNHPLVDSTRTFTAVVVSYPKSSGLATPTDTDNDGTADDISRIHMFVTDTAAISQGREGMSVQIVEGDYDLVEGLNRGDVVTFTGRLTFFNATSQVTVDQPPVLLGNVNSTTELAAYAPLLDPWVVSVDELNSFDAESNTQSVNLNNYSKYNGAYVKVEGATVTNVTTGDRPAWAVTGNGSRMYIYDTSLRYRNDRVSYLPSYNYRRDPDPVFTPPSPGSLVNLSGFVSLNGTPIDGTDGDGESFMINPMEDGVLWTGGQRYVSGETIPGVGVLDWPNDLEVIGVPPVFSEVAQSDSAVTSSDVVTVSATIVGTEGATITGANLIYSAGGVTDTLAMTAAGDVYSATIPAQANFTPVSFYLEATDSDGLVGRDPIAGTYGYFVQDSAINTISLIQTTADGEPGASPLAGVGALPMDITGTIVSDAQDGVIIVQDAAAAWSGIFLEITSETAALSRGDIINITEGTVIEADVASNSLTLTQLTDLTFSTVSSGNSVDAVVPVLTTDEVVAGAVSGELEPYEGMLVKFEGVQVVERGNFGEYVFQNTGADSTGGAIFNEDIRSDAQIGSVGVPYDINHSIRMNKTMDAYGIVAASFGAPKFHPRDVNDFITTDGNAFTPVLDFALTAPSDSAEVTVTEDFTFDWGISEDFDGDEITYAVAFYDTADNTLLNEPDFITGSSLTVTPAQADSFLVANGVADGDTGAFLWTVLVTDGSDTLQVHGSYGDFGDDFEPITRYFTITNSTSVSNEDLGSPKVFNLDQNYPNPFNPTTNIRFSLPQASNVNLVVYDMLGRKVATLLDNKQMSAANHTVRFDARSLASGMYIYRLEAGSFVSTRKMMLIK